MSKKFNLRMLDGLEREALSILIVVDVMRKVLDEKGCLSEEEIRKELGSAVLKMG